MALPGIPQRRDRRHGHGVGAQDARAERPQVASVRAGAGHLVALPSALGANDDRRAGGGTLAQVVDVEPRRALARVRFGQQHAHGGGVAPAEPRVDGHGGRKGGRPRPATLLEGSHRDAPPAIDHVRHIARRHPGRRSAGDEGLNCPHAEHRRVADHRVHVVGAQPPDGEREWHAWLTRQRHGLEVIDRRRLLRERRHHTAAGLSLAVEDLDGRADADAHHVGEVVGFVGAERDRGVVVIEMRDEEAGRQCHARQAGAAVSAGAGGRPTRLRRTATPGSSRGRRRARAPPARR